MSDSIKPVQPVFPVQPDLPPPAHEAARRQPQPKTKSAAASKPNDGYDLSAVTPDQATQLLATELMQHDIANSNPVIGALKDALSRRAAGAPTEQGDLGTLVAASSRIDSLKVSTYGPAREGKAVSKPISQELLAKVAQFDTLAASFGKPRDIMRG